MPSMPPLGGRLEADFSLSLTILTDCGHNAAHIERDAPDQADYEDIAWHRGRFMPPAAVQDAHLRLRLEAVLYLAHDWLNGEYLSGHDGLRTRGPIDNDIPDYTV